jgi:hypothetical protein
MVTKYILITDEILKYIEEHKALFENPTPKIGEKWYIEHEVTYPMVNNGNPVVEVANGKGDWMRLPKSIVDTQEEEFEDLSIAFDKDSVLLTFSKYGRNISDFRISNECAISVLKQLKEHFCNEKIG